MSRKSSVRFNGKWNLHESYGRKSIPTSFLFWEGYIGCKFNHTRISAQECKTAQNCNKQDQSYLLVVDFQGEKEVVFGAIAAAVKPYLKEMYLDMVPLEMEFGQSVVQNVEPFYQRKKGLFGLNW